jgi:hypothetical protein
VRRLDTLAQDRVGGGERVRALAGEGAQAVEAGDGCAHLGLGRAGPRRDSDVGPLAGAQRNPVDVDGDGAVEPLGDSGAAWFKEGKAGFGVAADGERPFGVRERCLGAGVS